MSDFDNAPLILTLMLDDAAHTYFNALRRRHFPPKINYLAAHLTLFHHLPGAELAAVCEQLHDCCKLQSALPLRVTGLRSLGRGVAFTLHNEELLALHRQLQLTFGPQLTPQDQQKLQPHVTIQNKVDPAAARQLLTDLQTDFAPFSAVGTGLELWAYRGGPWEALQQFPFAAAPAARPA
ncbi:2'-5' RNA ligase family protein [Hymenobacter sp. BT770]|uniref:2'-5' RNA ligase family protein n=1 Tax=Hymenobacter sp. BT770 TaxID=2886942 RepID=UPI001D11CDD7|nr:2'-5' RNA ligase family protein [Hymenobacter sp. BT770]MCC3154664.1 2'-5' RNA ligase family protein [Hymenobacter sp. BT770]MDO3416717.1 2'-5' RNA ligase family protein [Hymenobacter sp. BT770]